MDQFLKQSFQINFNYDICFTEQLFDTANSHFRDFLLSMGNPYFKQKIFFVIDAGVSNAHPNLINQISEYLKSQDAVTMAPSALILPGGESCKNDPEALASIIEAIDTYGIDRHSYVVGIGGGAILDLVGYAAAVSHRGIKHIRIPTTVLSQNDSGVGVKNSVNYKGKKNFLGTFTPPVAVFNDFGFLSSLDHRSWLAGLSEAIKVALIKDLAFFEWIESKSEVLPIQNSEEMKELIYRCADLHLEHIRNGDPFELGSSRPLDFGHWSAHKLEQLCDFKLLHGEAVAIGLAIDVMYSHYIGNIKEEDALRVIHLIQRLGLPIYHPILDHESARKHLIDGLTEFQEHLGGRLTVVLLEKLGKGKDYHQLDIPLILETIDYLKNEDLAYRRLHEAS